MSKELLDRLEVYTQVAFGDESLIPVELVAAAIERIEELEAADNEGGAYIMRLENKCSEFVARIAELEAALDVAQTALMEISHAQQCGPGWYTRGESGMYQQVRMWIGKASEAIKGVQNG